MASRSKQVRHRFTPEDLPVEIDYYGRRSNPFKISRDVLYENGETIKVLIPAGFECDASSTPFVVWLIPGILEVTLAACWWFGASPVVLGILFGVSVVISFGMPHLMPVVGQLGLHVRGTVVHDVLYRGQTVTRWMADSLLMEIMAQDGVRWLTRFAIWLPIRLFGWIAWRKNRAILDGMIEAPERGPDGESVVIPTATAQASPAVEKAIESGKLVEPQVSRVL